MARPTKQGIDYFPIDVNFDDKTTLYIMEKGSAGLSVLITTWQLIYQNEGYYVENNNDLYLMIKMKISLSIEEIQDCINACIRRNIFDLSQQEQNGILTSKAIQKRYFSAAKKKKQTKYNPQYLLIDVSPYGNPINVGISGIDSSGNATEPDVSGIDSSGNATNADVNVKGEGTAKRLSSSETLSPKCIGEDTVIFNSWNVFAEKYGLAKILSITAKRKANIKNRLSEEFFSFEKILEKIKESDFLLGLDKGWKVDFDFIFESRNNYLKILEGKYDKKGATQTLMKPRSELSQAMKDQMEAVRLITKTG